MKTILVTGGGGFIGSNLVAALLEKGTHHIVVCDMFSSNDKWRNLVKHPVSEIIAPENLYEWLAANRPQLDLIFHLGAISSTVEKNIDLILKHNFSLSLDLWRWCVKEGVRFIYASSSAVYGNAAQGFDDTLDLNYMKQLKPLSGYGWSKQLFDMHVASDVTLDKVAIPQWVGLRFFNAYGPNEYHKEDQQSVISKIAAHVVRGGTVKLFRSQNPQYPDGEQKRDVIYVKDCTRVMLWLLDHPNVSGLFNLGTGKARSYNDMARTICSAAKTMPHIHYIDMPETLAPSYQYFTEANMQRLRAAGYKEEFTSLESGVTDYVQNYLLKSDSYL